MLRRLITLPRLSLVLTAVLLLLIVLSYRWGVLVDRYNKGTITCIALHEGRIILGIADADSDRIHFGVAWYWTVTPHHYSEFGFRRNEWMGFGSERNRESVSDAPVGGNVLGYWHWRRWWMPLWLLAGFAAIPVLRTGFCSIRAYRRRRAEANRGHCTHCGYDLRASADRCPECGQTIAPQTWPQHRFSVVDPATGERLTVEIAAENREAAEQAVIDSGLVPADRLRRPPKRDTAD